MNRDALVAGQLADLADVVKGLRETLEKQSPPSVSVTVPESPPATVTVKAADVTPPAIVVNVPEQAAPVVNVNVPQGPAPTVNLAPEVNVLPPAARAYDVRITERDGDGFILAFVITPRGA